MGLDYTEKNRIENLTIPFGKHNGKRIGDIDVTYLDWLLSQQWFLEKFSDLAEDISQYLADPVVARELEAALEDRD